MIKRNPLPCPIVEIPWMQKLHRFMEDPEYTNLGSTTAFRGHPTVVALSDCGGAANRCRYEIVYVGLKPLERRVRPST